MVLVYSLTKLNDNSCELSLQSAHIHKLYPVIHKQTIGMNGEGPLGTFTHSILNWCIFTPKPKTQWSEMTACTNDKSHIYMTRLACPGAQAQLDHGCPGAQPQPLRDAICTCSGMSCSIARRSHLPQTGMSEWIANDLLHMQYPFKLSNSLTHCWK